MNVLMLKSVVLNTQQLGLPTEFSRLQKSVAKWIKVDCKLVCKWFPAEYQENE